MTFERRLRRRFAATRLAGALALGALGAITLGAVAYADGAAWLPAAAVGGVAAGAAGWWLRRESGSIARYIDPESDPDGLARAALAVDESSSLAGALRERASRAEVKFKRLEELRPMSALAIAALAAALWVGTTPGVAMLPKSDDGGFAAGTAPSEPAESGSREPGQAAFENHWS